MNISEHKLNIIRAIDQLPEESLLELEKLIQTLHPPKTTGFKKAIWLHERLGYFDGE